MDYIIHDGHDSKDTAQLQALKGGLTQRRRGMPLLCKSYHMAKRYLTQPQEEQLIRLLSDNHKTTKHQEEKGQDLEREKRSNL